MDIVQNSDSYINIPSSILYYTVLYYRSRDVKCFQWDTENSVEWNWVLNKMDNVQNCDSYINIPAYLIYLNSLFTKFPAIRHLVHSDTDTALTYTTKISKYPTISFNAFHILQSLTKIHTNFSSGYEICLLSLFLELVYCIASLNFLSYTSHRFCDVDAAGRSCAKKTYLCSHELCIVIETFCFHKAKLYM
jgi:hypothetical protein